MARHCWRANRLPTAEPIPIQYVNGTGGTTQRVIEPTDVFFDAMQPWCRLRQAERMFRLDRIHAVSPA